MGNMFYNKRKIPTQKQINDIRKEVDSLTPSGGAIATHDTLGSVIVGDSMSVTEEGVINVLDATEDTKGIAKLYAAVQENKTDGAPSSDAVYNAIKGLEKFAGIYKASTDLPTEGITEGYWAAVLGDSGFPAEIYRYDGTAWEDAEETWEPDSAATAAVEQAKEDALEEIEEAIAGIDVTYETISGDNVQLKNGGGDLLMPKTDAAIVTKANKNSSFNDSTTVEGIIDKIFLDENLSKNIDLDNVYTLKKYIGDTGNWKTSSTLYSAKVIPQDYDYIKVTAPQNVISNFAFLSGTEESGAASIIGSKIFVLAGESTCCKIPEGCRYIYVYFGATNSSKKPSSVTLYKSKNDEFQSEIDNSIKSPAGDYTEYHSDELTVKGLLKTDGTIDNTTTTENYRTSDYIDIEGKILEYWNLFPASGIKWRGLVIFDESKTLLQTYDTGSTITNHGIIDFRNDEWAMAKYVRFSTGAELNNLNTRVIVHGADYIEFTNQQVAEVARFADGFISKRNYGVFKSGNSSNPSNLIYSGNNSPCIEDGLVTKIGGYFSAAGTLKVATCFVDQNGFAILSDDYSVTIPASGLNQIDVSELGIILHQGEFLVAKNGTVNTKYGVDSSVVPSGIHITANYNFYIRNDGVYFCFNYEVSSTTKSLNEIDSALKNQEKQINAVSETINSMPTPNVMTDEVTGNVYKLVVRNGVLTLVPNQYSNVLVLGNSITVHPALEYWPAGNRGMAATKQEYDFCGIMQTQLRLKDNNAVVTRLNLAAWERDFTTDLSTLIGNNLTASTDLVVIRLGENVTNTSNFGTALDNLVTYIRSVNANVRIVITGVFWTSSTKENAISSAATRNNLDYVRINQFNSSAFKEAIGHYTYNTDYTAISEITNSGVANHPNNAGMCAIANEILSTIGYERSTNRYALSEVTVGGVTGSVYELIN